MHRRTLTADKDPEDFLRARGFRRGADEALWHRRTRKAHWLGMVYPTCCGTQVVWWPAPIGARHVH